MIAITSTNNKKNVANSWAPRQAKEKEDFGDIDAHIFTYTAGVH